MPELHLVHLTKTYGSIVAVDDLSLSLTSGEFFVLLGPSGAGKTTTLELVAGIKAPDRGRILLGERDLTAVPPQERRIAMAFENYALYPHKTVYDNLAFPLRSPKYRVPEQQVDALVRRVASLLGLDHVLAHRPSELSGGQRQRVCLGRVMIRPADVILLDEPLSHLDAKLRHTMRAEFKHLEAMISATVLYVTHDYLEAMGLGDRIGVLDHGVLQQVGTPRGLYEHPANEFVARALGTPEINLLPGCLEEHEGVLRFVGGAGVTVPLTSLTRRALTRARECRDVHLGIRPVHLTVEFDAASAHPDWPWLDGRVYVVEPLGHRSTVSVEVGGTQLEALVAGQIAAAVGQPARLRLPPDRLHLFDAKTGVNLVSGGDDGTA